MRKAEGFKIIMIVVLLMVVQSIIAQDKKESLNPPSKRFTIENCVNQFTMDKAIKTKSGYRYWFADKDFIDGRTLKMSVIAPNQETHAPHKHATDEFFFILAGKARFYLDGKTGSLRKRNCAQCNYY